MNQLIGAKGKGLPGGALFPPVWSISLIALGAALLLSLMASASALSQSTMMLGVDVSPGTNHSSSIGDIESCVSHAVGDEFTVDVFVNNVIDLTSWELRIDYDSDVVQVTEADFNYFLLSTPPGGNVFPTLFETELPGRKFLAAAEFQGPPDTGSGVLARLSMKAVGEGSSDISIASDPFYFAPRLTSRTGATIGDGNGDGYWDGSIVGGEIRVGGSCGSDAPVVTPKPSLAPGTTPDPGPGSGGGAVLAATSAPVVIVPGSETDSGADGPGNSSSDAGNDTSGDVDPGSEGRGGNGPNDDRSDQDGDTGAAQDGGGRAIAVTDDDGGANGLLLVALAFAAAALAVGALLYTFSRRFAG